MIIIIIIAVYYVTEIPLELNDDLEDVDETNDSNEIQQDCNQDSIRDDLDIPLSNSKSIDKHTVVTERSVAISSNIDLSGPTSENSTAHDDPDATAIHLDKRLKNSVLNDKAPSRVRNETAITVSSRHALKRRRKRVEFEKNNIIDSDSEISDQENRDPHVNRPRAKSAAGMSEGDGRKKALRVQWTDEELNILKRSFSNFLRSDSAPGYSLIKEVQKKHPVLAKRTPAQIKSRFIHLKGMCTKN